MTLCASGQVVQLITDDAQESDSALSIFLGLGAEVSIQQELEGVEGGIENVSQDDMKHT